MDNETVHSKFIHTLKAIVGAKHVLTSESQTRSYRTGIRFGKGKVLAVITPGSILEQWQVLEACVENDIIVIMQAANTGLTGGSTPDGNDYDRDVVIINTLRIDKVHVIDKGKQVVCLSGSTLYKLEEELSKYNRAPHSVIGSSCIGASVIGGVCNNSGGSLVQRGPAYTEMALFAKINQDGKLELVNHLGINLGDQPEEILKRLENKDFTDSEVQKEVGYGHAHTYKDHVRQIDENTPSRFNANPKYLHEASGSAGRIMVFAVRMDTFEKEKKTKVFYIGTNNIKELNEIRRKCLTEFESIPISGEYIHREAFDVAKKYGKDTFLMIKIYGTAALQKFFKLKYWADNVFDSLKIFPSNFPDRIAQFISDLFPNHLPKRMLEYRDLYEHHLILKMGGKSSEEAQAFLDNYFSREGAKGAYFECNAKEAEGAMLHRFAVASAANKYKAIKSKQVEDIVALDIALPRNEEDWFEKLPEEVDQHFIHKLYYGHFMCHVFHQDYIAKKGSNTKELDEKMLAILDTRGAEYPAEHNVGHLYKAKPSLKNFYQSLDPTNSMNPGIGKTSKLKNWQ